MTGPTATGMALTLHRATSAYLGAEAVGSAPEYTGDLPMPGEFQVKVAATGPRFRVTVTLMADEAVAS